MFDWIRAILADYRAWRHRRRVGPILSEIEKLNREIERAKKQHRSVRKLDARRKALRNQQLKVELSL